jgi:hypothetical protein
VVFHAASASRGRGNVSEVRPSQPEPVVGLRVCGSPDVARLEVRAARVLVSGTLHEREMPLVEDVQRVRLVVDCNPSTRPRVSLPTCSTWPAGIAIDGRRL